MASLQLFLGLFCLLPSHGYIIDPTFTKRTFHDANQFCKNTYNSSLASVYTPEQNEIVIELCLQKDDNDCWIGLHQNVTKYGDHQWHWIENGLISSFYAFKEPEPNDSGGDENCTEIICRSCSFSKHYYTTWYLGGEWNNDQTK